MWMRRKWCIQVSSNFTPHLVSYNCKALVASVFDREKASCKWAACGASSWLHISSITFPSSCLQPVLVVIPARPECSMSSLSQALVGFQWSSSRDSPDDLCRLEPFIPPDGTPTPACSAQSAEQRQHLDAGCWSGKGFQFWQKIIDKLQ